ncbi:MAG: parB-like partition protein [Rhizorhabdus sp.]|nr:parB-like partition protein [Rhizorhabdus sp.]
MARFLRDILDTLSYDPPVPPPSHDAKAPLALSRLDQRLAGFVAQGTSGQREAMKIQPGQCAVWDGNPRDQPGLTPENCRTLIESIAAEGGNRIPVLVRLHGTDPDTPYELLVGSRRRFAVDWLNRNGRPEIRLYALIVDLTDEEAFRLADIENRERADITDLDRARSYQTAVDRFYGGVQSRMAEALTLSNSQLSRLISLALLPDAVVEAFGAKEDIRVRHSEVLTPLLKRIDERHRLIEAATAIAGEQRSLAKRHERAIPPATVLARLRSAARPAAEDQVAGAIVANGTRIGRVKPLKAGAFAIELSLGPDVDLDDALAAMREAIEQARAGVEEEVI